MEYRDVTKNQFIMDGFVVFTDKEAITVIEKHGEDTFEAQQAGLLELFPNAVFPNGEDSYRFLMYHCMLEHFESSCFDLLATVDKGDSGTIEIVYNIVKGRDFKIGSFDEYTTFAKTQVDYLELLKKHLVEVKNNPLYAEEE